MCGVHSADLQLLSLCLFLTLSAVTLGQQHGPRVKVVVTEGDDALLPCSLSTKQSVVQGVFDWKKDKPQKEVFLYTPGTHYNNGRTGQSVEFKGRVFHFQDELKHSNTSIIIKDTKAADSGNYTCVFPRVQPPEKYNIELVVAIKPYTSIVNVTLDGALLQCEVRGAAPEPCVQWQDGAGNVLHAVKIQNRGGGGRFYISLFTTVTKTDVYRCVVTQEDIRHQTQAETFVYINERVCEDPSGKVATGWLFGALVLGAFIVLAFQALPGVLKRIAILHNKGRRHRQENDRLERATFKQGNGSSKEPPEAVPLKTQDV